MCVWKLHKDNSKRKEGVYEKEGEKHRQAEIALRLTMMKIKERWGLVLSRMWCLWGPIVPNTLNPLIHRGQ